MASPRFSETTISISRYQFVTFHCPATCLRGDDSHGPLCRGDFHLHQTGHNVSFLEAPCHDLRHISSLKTVRCLRLTRYSLLPCAISPTRWSSAGR
jgi:hypothetical protein